MQCNVKTNLETRNAIAYFCRCGIMKFNCIVLNMKRKKKESKRDSTLPMKLINDKQ